MKTEKPRFDLTQEACAHAFFEAIKRATRMQEVADALNAKYLPLKPTSTAITKSVIARALRSKALLATLSEMYPNNAGGMIAKFKRDEVPPSARASTYRRDHASTLGFCVRSEKQGEFKDIESELEPLRGEDGRPVTVNTVNDSMCRYPYEHTKYGYVFCGRTKATGAYCKDHAKQLGVTGQPSKRTPRTASRKRQNRLEEELEERKRRDYWR